MKEKISEIKKCSLFNRIKEEDLEALLSCLNAKIVEYDKNQTLFSEGKILHNFGIVLSGKLQTIQYDFSGSRSVLNLLEERPHLVP